MPVLTSSRVFEIRLRIVAAALLVAVGIATLSSATAFGGTIVPVATNDEYSVPHNQVLNVPAPGVLANDTLPPGWEISVVTTTAFGFLTLNADGSFQYEPAIGFVGDDSFVYQMAFVAPAEVGAAGAVPTATVTIHVTNNPPTPGNDNYATDQDTPLSVPAPGVLVNDSDPDGDPIAISGVADTTPNGTLNLDPTTGAFEYTPNPGFVGVDTFVYLVVDILGPIKQVAPAGLDGIPATVTITVTGVDTPTPEPTVPGVTPEPTQPAPTATTAPTGGVSGLPSTGSGPRDDSPRSWLLVSLLLIATGGIAVWMRFRKSLES